MRIFLESNNILFVPAHTLMLPHSGLGIRDGRERNVGVIQYVPWYFYLDILEVMLKSFLHPEPHLSYSPVTLWSKAWLIWEIWGIAGGKSSTFIVTLKCLRSLNKHTFPKMYSMILFTLISQKYIFSVLYIFMLVHSHFGRHIFGKKSLKWWFK